MSQVPPFLTRSAERMVAAHRLSQLAPGVDSLLLADRLDQACAELRKRGSSDRINELVAALLINLATCGENDPHHLCKRALDVISQQV